MGPWGRLDLGAVWLGFTGALLYWLAGGLIIFCGIIFTGAKVYHLELLLYLGGITGVLLGGIIAGRRAGKRGWLVGCWVGVLLGLLGLIINLELVPELYSWVVLGRQLFVWSLWGLVGGYMGTHFLTETPQMDKIKGVKQMRQKGRKGASRGGN